MDYISSANFFQHDQFTIMNNIVMKLGLYKFNTICCQQRVIGLKPMDLTSLPGLGCFATNRSDYKGTVKADSVCSQGIIRIVHGIKQYGSSVNSGIFSSSELLSLTDSPSAWGETVRRQAVLLSEAREAINLSAIHETQIPTIVNHLHWMENGKR